MAVKMWSLAAALVLLCTFQLSWSRSTTFGRSFLNEEKKVLDSILQPSQYDPRVRPIGVNDTGRDPPTIVSMNLYLLSVSSIDDVKMKFTIQLYLRQHWTDTRLAFDNHGGQMSTLSLTDQSKIWTPDIFFNNEIAGHVHNVLASNSFIRISNKTVYTSNRLSLTLSCPMNLKWYPFDTQICEMMIESYGLTAKDLILSWDKDTPATSADIRIPRFCLEKLNTVTDNIKLSSGEYTVLKLQLFFDRHVTPSMLQAFIPSAMLVLVSWLSFWLDNQAVVARVTLGIVTLCTASAHSFAYNCSTALVDYVTAMDVWFGVCLSFVMAALLVTISVNYKNRQDSSNAARADLTTESDDAKKHSNDKARAPNESADKSFVNYYHIWIGKISAGPSGLDVVARYAFPLAFLIFNVLYWAVILCHSLQ